MKLPILLAAGLCYGGSLVAADRPNLLLITADDMNADSPGWMGNPLKITPQLDALAASSHRFVNNHVSVPICQPSRAALLTGRVPHRSGALGFHPVNEGTPTLVTLLQNAGYFAAAMNKLGHMQPKSCFPWDQTFGNSGKNPSLLGAQVAEAIGQADAAGKPFFLNCNLTDPHRPFYGSEEAAKKNGKGKKAGAEADGVVASPLKASDVTVPSFLEDLPAVREEFAQYSNSIQRLDLSIGQILGALEASGHEKDTVVVFLSDHGMSFPFSKATDYVNGTRSPVLLRWPGLAATQTREEFVSSVDLLPTLLEVLKVPAPDGLDGSSWLPLLRGESQPGRDAVVTHVNSVSSGAEFPMRCIRTKNRALIVEIWPDAQRQRRVEAMKGLTFHAMAQAGETDSRIAGRVAQFLDGVPVAFYDLANDPAERENLFQDPAYHAEARALGERLVAELKRTGDPQLENVRNLLAGKPVISFEAPSAPSRPAAED